MRQLPAAALVISAAIHLSVVAVIVRTAAVMMMEAEAVVKPARPAAIHLNVVVAIVRTALVTKMVVAVAAKQGLVARTQSSAAVVIAKTVFVTGIEDVGKSSAFRELIPRTETEAKTAV